MTAMNWLYKTLYSLRRRGRALLKKILRRPACAPDRLLHGRDHVERPFIQGVNLPWLSYGGDFGASAWSPQGGIARAAKRDELLRVCRALAASGVHTIRWFLLCDGRAGLRFSRAGTPLGPDKYLFADIDTALEIAAECQMRIIFVLIDFLWFGKAATVSHVQVRGRAGAIGSAYKQRALRRRVLKPLFKRYGRSPEILAWDIVNEPEWATRGYGGEPASTIPYLAMRRFIKKAARMVQRYTNQLATVGLANAGGLSLVSDAGLDFYQVHWYDRWDAIAPLDKPAVEWNLDRPLLLGEYPTKNSNRPAAAIVAAAERSGYCGALGWSVLGTDRSSGIDLDSEEAR